MDELLSANYIADLKSIGRKDKMLSILEQLLPVHIPFM